MDAGNTYGLISLLPVAIVIVMALRYKENLGMSHCRFSGRIHYFGREKFFYCMGQCRTGSFR